MSRMSAGCGEFGGTLQFLPATLRRVAPTAIMDPGDRAVATLQVSVCYERLAVGRDVHPNDGEL